MVKKPIFLDDPFASPLPSPTPLLSPGSLKKVPGSALAERILNDPGVWKLLDGSSITDLRLPLDSSGIEEEMTWLENEINAFNLLSSPSSMFGESLTSQISDAIHSFDANSLQFASNHFESPAAPNTKSMPQRRVSPKARPIDLSSPYIYNPPGSLDEPRQNNEEPQEADSHVRFSHLLGRTEETRPLMVTVSVTEPVHDLSSPSSESSSFSSLSSGCGFHPSDDRTTQARPVCCALGPSPPNSGPTSLVSPLMAHSASATLSFLEWYGIDIDSKVAHTVEHQSLTRATPVQQSEADPSQSQECDDDTAPRLSGADAIVAYEVGGSSIPSKDEEQKDRTDFKSKMLAIHSPRDSTKPMPILDLPAVLNATSPTILPKGRAPPTYAKTDISREMTSGSPVRRLPMVPTRSAALTFGSGKASPLVNGPLPIPPHTSAHILRRSNTSDSIRSGAPRTPYRSTTSNYPTNSTSSTLRSPPCPVGPRNRHRRNNTTPIKSGWQSKNNTSITVSRSVSGIPPLHEFK